MKIILFILLSIFLWAIIGFTMALISWPKIKETLRVEIFWSTFERYGLETPYSKNKLQYVLNEVRLSWFLLCILAFPIALLGLLRKRNLMEGFVEILTNELF